MASDLNPFNPLDIKLPEGPTPEAGKPPEQKQIKAPPSLKPPQGNNTAKPPSPAQQRKELLNRAKRNNLANMLRGLRAKVRSLRLNQKSKQKPDEEGGGRKFMAVHGITVLNDRVLLPRQVVPFSRSWSLLVKDLYFMRWQVALQTERDDVTSVVQPVPAHPSGRCIMADKNSYTVKVFPDGCAGFTGQYMTIEKPMSLAYAKRLGNRARNNWKYDLGVLRNPNPDEAVRKFLPRFYMTISPNAVVAFDEVTRLRKLHRPGDRVAIRRVFDIQSKKWLWLSELPFRSPVVISDMDAFRGDYARTLHHRFGGFQDVMANTIYIGGNGMMGSPYAPFNLDELEPNDVEERLIEETDIRTFEFMGLDEKELMLTAALLPMHDTKPAHDQERKGKHPKERHDAISEIPWAVNQAAYRMARQILS